MLYEFQGDHSMHTATPSFLDLCKTPDWMSSIINDCPFALIAIEELYIFADIFPKKSEYTGQLSPERSGKFVSP